MWPFQNETIETFKFISRRQILPQYLRDKFTLPTEDDLKFKESAESPLKKVEINIKTKVTHPIVTERELVFERKVRKEQAKK